MISMNTTLEYISNKFGVSLDTPSPINISVSRWTFLPILEDLGFAKGAEIGTDEGSYAEQLCIENTKLEKLYCIDPWTYGSYHISLGKNITQPELDKQCESVKERLAQYNKCEILRMTSMEAVKKFEPNSLDFVYIDGDHNFEFIVNDIIHWSRVVSPGGIVYGHDYNDRFHVMEAVNAYMQVYDVKPWFVLSKHGKLIDCWMYVRQEDDKIFY